MKKMAIMLIVLMMVSIGFLSGCNEQITNNEGSSVPKIITVGIGGNYTTIQEAINNAKNGDTIQVKIGTYTENIVIDKQIILQGTNSENTVIDGGGNGNTISISGDGVVISDFTIKGGSHTIQSGSWPEYGISLEGCKNCRISNNIITNNEWGIECSETESISIINNKITLSEAHGISVWMSNYTYIISNEISFNKDGILHRLSDNCVIANNTIIENNERGITMGSSSYNLILSNIISSNHNQGILLQPGYDVNSEYNYFKDNLITLNGMEGFYLNCPNSDDTVIENIITENIIKNNNVGGITTEEIRNSCSGNTIENND